MVGRRGSLGSYELVRTRGAAERALRLVRGARVYSAELLARWARLDGAACRGGSYACAWGSPGLLAHIRGVAPKYWYWRSWARTRRCVVILAALSWRALGVGSVYGAYSAVMLSRERARWVRGTASGARLGDMA